VILLGELAMKFSLERLGNPRCELTRRRGL
jgi:hypothetical protein